MQNKNISLQIEMITQSVSLLLIDETKIINIIKIQKWFRGSILRLKQLPLIMYKIKKLFAITSISIFIPK